MECPICLNEIDSAASHTECGHVFHSRCLLEAAHHDPRCPICRAEFCKPLTPSPPPDTEARVVRITYTPSVGIEEYRRERKNYMRRKRRIERRDDRVSTLRNRAEDEKKAAREREAMYETTVRQVVSEAYVSESVVGAKRLRDRARHRMKKAVSQYEAAVVARLGEPPSPPHVPSLQEAVERAMRGDQSIQLSLRLGEVGGE